ncbi:MAG: DUF4340 domain-containing protein [Terriglobia bacterium]|jgi:hypothetical protein
MKRKYINTLIALVILAALWGAFTYYNRRQGREASKIEPSKEEKLFTLDSKHITAITFRPRSGDAVTCEHAGGAWAIVEPKKLSADQGTLSTVLNNLTTATVDEVVEPHASDVKQFGLDPAAYSIEVSTDANPPKFTLLLGDDTPTSSGLYAQVAGNPRVVTVASYLKSNLEKTLFDLRDRRALTVEADQLRKMEVESKGKKYTLEKNPEGVWDLVLPPSVRADRFAVDGLLNQLRGLSMQSIAAEDKKSQATYGLSSPELRLELTGPSGAQTLLLGKKDKEGDRYFAVNSALPPVFTLNSSFLTDFQKDPADFRSKDLFTYSSFDVKHVEITSPKGHSVFEQQKDNQWKQTEGGSKTVPSAKMDTLLSRLRDLRVTTFPKSSDPASLGLNKPSYQFKVRFGDKNQTETLEISKVGDHVYARLSTDPLPCEVAKSAFDDMEKALNDLGP